MRIASLYYNKNQENNIDKSNFYLGLVSHVGTNDVRVQVENMTLFKHRILSQQSIIANTIDYYVIIDSINGTYIGRVKETGVRNNDNVHRSLDAGSHEEILPFKFIDILGYSPSHEDSFLPLGFNNVGVGDKVYVASEKAVRKYLNSIEIHIESKKNTDDELTLGQYANLPMIPFKIDSNILFNRHLMIIGATGSGKSTSALRILEELVIAKKKVIMVDPTGEYKETFKDSEFSKYKLGTDTYLNPGEISIPQWAILFKTNEGTQPSVIANAITSLRLQYKKKLKSVYKKDNKKISSVVEDLSELDSYDKDFHLEFLTEQIREESVRENREKYIADSFTLGTNTFLINKVNYLFKNTKFLNFFQQEDKAESKDLYGILDDFLVEKEKNIYIDISSIGSSDEIGAVIVDLIVNYLLLNGTSNSRENPFTLFIDEVHRYTNKKILGENVLTGLEGMAREGRKLGQYLFLTTQSPLDIPENLLSQVGTLLSHRLTHQNQLNAIRNYMEKDSYYRINKLGIGEAILTSSNLLQNINLKMDESKRKHDNESPHY